MYMRLYWPKDEAMESKWTEAEAMNDQPNLRPTISYVNIKMELLAAILVIALAFTSVRAADLTPAETKAIAEEGFIYGLPIVMNYAVMYEFAVDAKASQFKAPFNEINNEHRVATYEDTAVVTPNSDTPYSFLWLDLRAEPMVISVPAVDKERYYSVQLIDGNTYNYGYIGSRATGNEAGDYMVVGPDWKGETPAGIKKVFTSTTPFALAVYRTQLFNPERHAERGEGAGGLQGAAAFRVPQATRAASRTEDRFPPGHHEEIKTELLRVSGLRPAVRARHRRKTRKSGPSSPASASGRARPSSSRTSRSNRRPPSRGHEGGRGKGRKVSRQRNEEYQWLEHRLVFRRPRFLQGRLADARRCRQGRHLRQRRRGSDVSL